MHRSNIKVLPSTSLQANNEETPFCGFCMSENILPVNLRTCKHFLFYIRLFLITQKQTVGMSHICVRCHTMLKKIFDFNAMFNRTQNVLLRKVNQLNRVKTCYNLNFSKPTHVSYDPTEIKIKLEPDIPHPEPIESENNVKTEFDSITIDWPHPFDSDNHNDSFICNTEEIKETSNDDSNFINIDAPEFICSKNGVQLPVISKTLIGKTLPLPKSSSDKVQEITITLKELLEENRRKSESITYLSFPFKCIDCVIGFSLPLLYKRHMENHTIMPNEVKEHLICDICYCVLPAEQSETHYMKHFTRYQCSECNEKFVFHDCATKHYKETHAERITFKCEQCAISLPSIGALRYHRTKYHTSYNNDRQSCASNDAFTDHRNSQHSSPEREIKSACPICEKIFIKRMLQNHVDAVHNSDKNNMSYCVECNKFFKNLAKLREHYLNHRNHADPNQRVQCDNCGKIFNSKSLLSGHIHRVHVLTKENICELCNKGFSGPRILKRHINRVHLKIRPNRDHICNFCGKGFTRKQILVDHTRCHTGERPYKCEICDATFTQNGSLHTHIKLKHKKEKKKS